MDTTIDQLIRLNLPAARDGDRDAYGRIVAACQNTITAIALAITRDVPSSEDIAQDAFLSAWQHLRRLHNADSFLPWLRQITRNLARDHLRAKVRGPFQGDDVEAAIAAAADPAPSPMHALIDEEQHRAAADVISALPEDSRETLLLFYREGQSSKQVAALLGLSDAAVRKRLSRARQQVRDDLLARFAEFAQGSAPAAAFATIVTSALVVASPPAAAATLIGGAGLGAKTLGQVLLGAATGMGIGLAAASASIFWGWRKQMREAMDAQERRELTRSAIVNVFAIFGYLVAMLLTTTWTRGWVVASVATCVFMGMVFWQTGVVQPRAKARRFAQEARVDPEGAAKRRRRERIQCRIGLVVGSIGGFGGLIAGLVASGRIAF
ncbi:RNA polymerase ECF-type sigma factor [Lysobacter dokdonensis DS-58]|uniref:RNA polymerase sigma factor n=1 Tax=Lysobacter dokdonensis DS-58 TaxID=1300345 RepID=A0A0A2WHR0_9GAMM|nr:sigma-70 family RNA polymerase sigma factor [Lysobacter dokdonensis]KGQ19701.1 RNA polymerase ECF-type sigma factor [Lysobacter dokdonensis DS-58]